MTSPNLALSANHGQKIFVYLDSKGAIQFEQDRFLNCLKRAITFLLGFRNYDLAQVLPAMQKMEASSQNAVNIRFLFRKKTGLSTFDLQNLELLSRFYDPSKQCVYRWEESQSLFKFIEGSIGNQKLNRAVKKLMALTAKSSETLIHHKALETILYFSYKTTFCKSLNQAVQKIEKIRPKLTKKGMIASLKKQEKLTRHELITMENAEKILPILREFKMMKLPQTKNCPLATLTRATHIISNFTKQVQNIAQRQAPHAKSGVLIFYDTESFAARRGYLQRIFDIIVFKGLFRTSIFHASLGYQDKKKRNIEADIWTRFNQRSRTLDSYTYKTIKFNVDQLVNNNEERKKLEKLYGKNWKLALETKYHRYVKESFKNSASYQHFYNPMFRRVLVGLGFRWKLSKSNFKNRIKFHSTQSVCSEFVIKSLAKCFLDLQKEVSRDWKNSKRTPDDDSPPQLRHPIREKRRLERVTPNEMLRYLSKQEFATKVPIPSIIKNVIQIDT